MSSLLHHHARLLIVTGFIASFLFLPRLASSQSYTIIKLGDLGGHITDPYAINNKGQVVGSSYLDGGPSHAFLWQKGVMTDLGTLGDNSVDYSYAYGINDNGQIVGSTSTGNGYHAFLWQDGVMNDLGTLGGEYSEAWGINAAGQIVGWASTANGDQHAFLWQKGVMTDIGTLGADTIISVSGINASDQVIGVATKPDGTHRAFLCQNGTIIDIGDLGGPQSAASSINSAGLIVGWSDLADYSQHAFLWKNGVISDLGTLGGDISTAGGINSAGLIVGSATVAPANTARAVLWRNGRITDINTLIPANTGYYLAESIGVNDLGQITGIGNLNNVDVAFVLIPNPTAIPQTVSVDLGKPTAITLAGIDYDTPPLPLAFAVVTQPANGKLTGLNTSTGAVTYTPGIGFKGTDSFTFTVSNGSAASSPATVTLHVTVGTPTAIAQTVSIARNTATKITLTGTDPDIPALPITFAIKTSPVHGVLGALNRSTGVATYTPNTNFQGKDTFTFTVSNSSATSIAATVTLKVAPGTPRANGQTVSVAHNTGRAMTLTGSDPDSPELALTYAIVTSPANGTLTGLNKATGAVTYIPKANFQGTDTFTFTVSNGTNTSAAATVTLKVAPGTPTANPQTVTVPLNTRVSITLTGLDPDIPALKLTFAIATQPTHGILGSLNTATGVLVFTPVSGYKGTDSFTFTVSNGANKSAAAKVTLNIDGG